MGAPRFALLLLCFLLSGIAALVYQTAWSQELALAFGASQPAVAAVLAATMAGLAAGAALAGRWEQRLRRPLRAYALLELAIGASALAVPMAVRGAGAVQQHLLAGRAEEGAAATAFALGAALLILFVPNALMGATLPLVARRVVRARHELGPRLAGLYAANTLGAGGGALLCAFVLIPRLGLGTATAVAALMSWLAGLVALALDRDGTRTAAAIPAAATSPGQPPAAAGRWVLPAILLSGAVSFAYEVTWTRLLGHLLGGSIYAFGTMLATFLLGLAAGSAAATRWARDAEPARRAFGTTQLATAAVTLLAHAALDRLPALLTPLAGHGGGSRLAVVLATAGLMFPGAVAIGASVPLAIRILARDADDATRASARVLTWNTIGSILGALATGFVLLPALGLAGTITAAVAVNLVLAAGSALAWRPRQHLLAAAALGIAGFLAVFPPATAWSVLRSTPVTGLPIEGEVTFLAAGRAATVLVLDRGTEWRLSTDGMPEAAIQPPGARPGQQPMTGWLSLLPLAARPTARTMLVIGLGGGSTLEEVPAGVREITVVEIEPEVVHANRQLATRRRRDPLADPRMRVVVNDARSFLRLTDQRFDVIVSQPSHPWTAGASHLFTREAFVLARERLAADGVFAQWIGLDLVDPATLRSLVATLRSVFPHVEAFTPPPGTGMLFLASPRPLALDAAQASSVVASTAGWRIFGVHHGDDLLLARVLDDGSSRAFAANATLNLDHRNLLATRSPRLVQRPLAASLDELTSALAPFDPLPQTPDVDLLYATAQLLDARFPARALRAASAIADPVTRETAFALATLTRGDARRGQQELWHLISTNPDSAPPRRALTRWQQRSLRDLDGASAVANELLADPTCAVLITGWQRLEAGDTHGVAALEERLAQIDARDLLFEAATRLRILWRQASGDPTTAREAIDLLDPLLAARAPVADLLLRARLGLTAGQQEVVLASLAEVAVAARGKPQLTSALRAASAILDQLPDRTGAAETRLRALLAGSNPEDERSSHSREP